MRNRTVALLLLGTLAFSPALASTVSDTDPLEQHAIEMAKTPSDHMALGEHYRAKAADAKAEAARHDSMGRAYGRGKMGTGLASGNCKRLSKASNDMAAEYEELAKLHEGEAKKSQ